MAYPEIFHTLASSTSIPQPLSPREKGEKKLLRSIASHTLFLHLAQKVGEQDTLILCDVMKVYIHLIFCTNHLRYLRKKDTFAL